MTYRAGIGAKILPLMLESRYTTWRLLRPDRLAGAQGREPMKLIAYAIEAR